MTSCHSSVVKRFLLEGISGTNRHTKMKNKQEIRSVERGKCPIAASIMTDTVIFQYACGKLPYLYFPEGMVRC